MHGGLERSSNDKGFFSLRHGGLDKNGTPNPGVKPFQSSQLLDLQRNIVGIRLSTFLVSLIRNVGSIVGPDADWVHEWLDNSGFRKTG